jgi:hypothetical protein
MPARGRKPASEVQQAVAVVTERLAPPPDLSPPETEAWIDFLNSVPAEKYGPEHIPLIKHHIRTAVYADQMAYRVQHHLAQADKEGVMFTSKEQAQFTNMVNTHLGLGKSLKMTTTSLAIAPYERKDRTQNTPTAEVWED